MIEEFKVKATVKEEMKSSAADVKNLKNTETEQGCFVCHGTGHWAREVIRKERRRRKNVILIRFGFSVLRCLQCI